ncbi:hypothetical protein B0H10DRAFT_2029026, partial [Mycena sp. CBHHK59/15]
MLVSGSLLCYIILSTLEVRAQVTLFTPHPSPCPLASCAHTVFDNMFLNPFVNLICFLSL